MKVRASRADRDLKDIPVLYALGGFTYTQEALDYVSTVFHKANLMLGRSLRFWKYWMETLD
jgi:hypothetical protein